MRVDHRPSICSVNLSRRSFHVARRLKLMLKPADPAHRERGQALIEMVLVLPIIVIFILVLVDFGVAIDRREVLQHAVYEGGREGIVGTTVDEIKDRTVAQSQGLLAEGDVSVCYVDADVNGDIGAGDDVRVSANYTHNFVILSGSFFGLSSPSISLTPEADAKLANGPQGSEPAC